MFQNVAFGLILIVATTVIHAASMGTALRFLSFVHAGSWNMSSPWARVSVVTIVVVVMCLATTVEISLWAGTYLAVGALSGTENAIYFSSVTFSTLGYGDVVLGEQWRILASFEAVNGTIMFGWTTALIVAAVHRVYLDHSRQTR